MRKTIVILFNMVCIWSILGASALASHTAGDNTEGHNQWYLWLDEASKTADVGGDAVTFTAYTNCDGDSEATAITISWVGPENTSDSEGPTQATQLSIDVPTSHAGIYTITATAEGLQVDATLTVSGVSFDKSAVAIAANGAPSTGTLTATAYPPEDIDDVVFSYTEKTGLMVIDIGDRQGGQCTITFTPANSESYVTGYKGTLDGQDTAEVDVDAYEVCDKYPTVQFYATNGATGCGCAVYEKDFDDAVTATTYGISDGSVIESPYLVQPTRDVGLHGNTGGDHDVFSAKQETDASITITVAPVFTATIDGQTLTWTMSSKNFEVRRAAPEFTFDPQIETDRKQYGYTWSEADYDNNYISDIDNYIEHATLPDVNHHIETSQEDPNLHNVNDPDVSHGDYTGGDFCKKYPITLDVKGGMFFKTVTWFGSLTVGWNIGANVSVQAGGSFTSEIPGNLWETFMDTAAGAFVGGLPGGITAGLSGITDDQSNHTSFTFDSIATDPAGKTTGYVTTTVTSGDSPYGILTFLYED